jgi:hypothetical protein
MGASSANVSRNMFNEQNRYIQTVLQAGVPVMDADYNDGEQSFYTQLRRAITNTIGDGSRGDAFLISGIPANNDFTINGGDLGDMGPETLYVKGHQATLFTDETYLASVETAPTVTGASGAVLTNSAANYIVNELVGKTITPNLDNPGTTFTILSNTVNTITTDSADLALAGVAKDNRYRVHLTTPPAGPDRTDLVYIDVYLDEIDATEDTNLIHTVDTIQFESMRRLQVKEAVFVREGITLPVALPSGYVDADGNRHVQIPIALLTRPQLNPQITDGMITDLRPSIFTLEEMEARFVNAAGDTMTGALVMDADIEFNAGQRITGVCVIDSDQICPEAVEQRHFDRTEHLLGDGGEVPTFSEVNDPLDPGHFNVHDNRYYTKNQIENLIGTNLVENGLFDDDFNAWENATPQPLSGGPDFEAASTVFATIGMCGSVCSTNCTCRVLQVCAQPGSRVCFVCPVRQEINLQCGGQFLLVNTLCVTKGDEFVKPYFLLDLYSSCNFLGTQRIDLFVPPADDPTKPGVAFGDGFTRLEKIIELPPCVDQVFLTPCYDVTFDTPLPDGEVFPSSPFGPSGPSPEPSPATSPAALTGSLPAKCEVGPDGLEFAVCAVQMRRITGTEGEFSRPGGNTTAEPRITGCDEVSRTISFERGTGQVSTVIERLEEMQGGVRIGKLPTHFPGVVLQPNSCIDEADVSTLPVSTCNCSITCTDPGGPLAIPECYLYGPENGNQNRGCPEITDEALGVSVGTQLDQFLLRLDLDPAPVNFLQLAGADEDNTAVKFRLGRDISSVFDQEMRVLAIDDEGRRAMYGFESAAASAVRRITVPLSSFDRLDNSAFDWTQVTALYVGYAMGYFATECQFSIDNVWVCTKTDASTYSFENVASVAPHTDVNVDETCVTLQDFELESSIDLVTCNAPMPTATSALDPNKDECVQLQTIIPVEGEGTGSIEFEVGPGIQAAPWGICLNGLALNISAEPSPKFSVAISVNRAGASAWLVARSSNNGVAIEEFTGLASGDQTITADFGTDLGLANPFDDTDIEEICLYIAPIEGPKTGDIYQTDNWQIDPTGGGTGPTLLEGWNDATQAIFDARTDVECGYGVGLVANNTFATNTVLSTDTIPLVALSADRTKRIAYWGQNEDTIRDADVVLVPAEFMNDSIVGINGNKGLDDLGAPLAGTLEALARDTGACYGTVAFEDAPFAGCRNIWMDLVYLDEVECEGLTPELTEFEFFDTGCACITPATTFDVSNFATDDCLPRILPDDEFGGLPDDHPEAINFEYCALPRLDRNEADGNEFFDIVRETPACARPDQGYYVRVTLRSKADGQTIDWIDTLPAGHTLLSGSLSATTAVLNTGEQEVHEYVVKTPGPGSPDVTITGNAELSGQPLTNLSIESDPIEITENCPSMCFTSFGSQNANVFGQVFWAGGGRTDPVPAADVGLYTTFYAGSGSAAVSLREAFLTVNETVGVGATSHTFNILPAEIGGFAVDQEVWVFNTNLDPATPDRKIHIVDIENEEATAAPDREITGIYGTITAIDATLGTIDVAIPLEYRPTNPPNAGGAVFSVAAQASIMVAPIGSKGFYWETSEKLAELCGNAAAISQCIIRWGYRFWNGSKYPCPDKLGASFVCDGDGETTQFPIQGDQVKDIINPRDWIGLGFSAPVIPVLIKTDVVPTDTTVEVCDVCSFAACDIVQIIDNNCTGQDGGGPGYVGTVVSTDTCTPPTTQGNITITPEIPSNIVGCSTFTGFDVAESAIAFVKPDICRLMFSPTTKVNPDGTPVDGPNFVGVDFDTGLFTFDPSVNATNPELCFRETQTVLDFSAEENGIYFLVGVDEKGRRSPPSKPILLGTIEKAAPPDGYIGEIKIIRQDNPGPPFDEVVIEFCRVGDSTNRRVLSPPSFLTVSAASSGAANTLDTGVLAPDTWYFIYAIGDSTGAITTDAGLLSLSPGAPYGAGPPGSPTGISPLMPPGYDCFRRIGSVRTLSSGDFNQFRTINRTTLYEQTISFGAQNNRIGTGGGGAGAPTLISAAVYIPPTSERAIIHATADTAAAGASDEVRFVDGATNPTPFVPPGFRSVVVKIGNTPGGSSSEVFELGLSPMQEFWWSHSGLALGFIAAYARGYVDDLKHV